MKKSKNNEKTTKKDKEIVKLWISLPVLSWINHKSIFSKFSIISLIMIVSIGNATGLYTKKSYDRLGDTSINSSANKLTNENGIVAHWKFDETSGIVAEDSVGGFHGTIHGDAVWTAGRVGNALLFDGIDDYVDLPQNAIDVIGDLTQGTISFWFNYTYLIIRKSCLFSISELIMSLSEIVCSSLSLVITGHRTRDCI